MADEVPHLPEWRRAYDAALQAADTRALFKLVEIAEAAILTRRHALAGDSDHHDERAAIERALTQLDHLKEKRLGFHGPERDNRLTRRLPPAPARATKAKDGREAK
jgi:hypothetical protein